MKPEYCVLVDGDGHFHISLLIDRKKTIENLKTIEDGDCWANEADEYFEELGITEEELMSSNYDVYKNFVLLFTQRGRMELCTL